MIALVHSTSYAEISLCNVRRPGDAEISHYRAEVRSHMYVGADSRPMERLPHVVHDDIYDIIGGQRRCDGSLPGHNNHLWVLTEAQVEHARTMERNRAVAEKRAKASTEQHAAQVLADAQVQAARTGEVVLLRSYMTDCHERLEDCSFDSCVECMWPDGVVRREYTHCY